MKDLEPQDTTMPQSVARGQTAHFHASTGLGRLPGPNGERSFPLFEHGTLTVELYAPRGHDPQTPHTRDEIYVVASGTGVFVDGTARRRFGPGDFIFVAAGVPHHFEDFTADFVAWVMFYGPQGGEADPAIALRS